MQPRRPIPFRHHLPDRVVLRRHGAQPFGHRRNPVAGQRQAVHHRGAQALVAPEREVLCVGLKDLVRARDHRIGRSVECRALGVGRGEGKRCRRRPSAGADVGHHGRDVVEVLHVVTMSSRWIRAARPG
jgi:hypothetical protein